MNENSLIFIAIIVLVVVAVAWFVTGHYLLSVITLLAIMAFIAFAGRRPRA